MMENYDRTVELISAAEDSAGKANEQYAKYADTIENKITQLKNSWEQLKISIFDSDFFKQVIDLAKTAVDNLNTLHDQIGTGGLIVTFTILGKLIKSVGTDSLNSFKSEIQKIGNIKIKPKADTSEIDKAKVSVEELGTELEKVSAEQHTVHVDVIKTEKTVKEGEETPDVQVDQTKAPENSTQPQTPAQPQPAQAQVKSEEDAGLQDSKKVPGEVTDKQKKQSKFNGQMLGQATASALIAAFSSQMVTDGGFESVITTSLTAAAPQAMQAVGSLGTALVAKLTGDAALAGEAVAAAGVAGLTAGIAAGIGLIAGLLVLWYKHEENLKIEADVDIQTEKAEEKLEKLQSNLSATKDQIDNLNSSSKTLNEAVKNYNTLSNKVVKTEEEQTKLNEAYTTLTETYPEVLSYYDDETQKLQINQEALKQKNDALKEELDLQKELAGQQEIEVYTQKLATNKLTAAQDFQNATGIEMNAGKLKQEKDFTYKGQVIIPVDPQYDIRTQEQKDKDNIQISRESVIADKLGYDYDKYSGRVRGEGSEELQQAMEYLWGEAEADLSVFSNEQIDELNKIKSSFDTFTNESTDYYTDALTTAKEMVEINSGDKTEAEKAMETVSTANSLASASEVLDNAGVLDKLLNGDYNDDDGAKDNAENAKDNVQAMANDIVEAFGSQLSEDEQDQIKTMGKDAQNAIKDITWGWNTRDSYADLDSKTKKALNTYMGIDTRQKYDEWVKEGALSDDDAASEFTQAVYNKMLETITEEFGAGKIEFDKETQDAVSKLNDSGKLTKEEYQTNYDQVVQNLKDQGVSQEVIDKIMQTLAPNADTNLKNYDLAIKVLGKDLKETGDTASQVAAALAQLETAGVQNAEQMLQEQANYLKTQGFGEEDIASLLQIDWSKVSDPSKFDSFKKEQIEAYGQLGIDITDEMFDQMAKTAKKYKALVTTVTTPASLKAYQTTLDTLRETAYSDKDTFITAINDAAEDGILTLSNYLALEEKIKELGGDIQDFTSIASDGTISLNSSALSAYYIEQVSSAEKLRAQRDSLINQINNTTNTSEKKTLQSTLDKLEEELPRAQALQQAYIKEYVDGLKETAETAKENVKDLKKKVLEAQDSVIENQKKLNELISGTKDWINNADDLYNYTTALERFTKAADDAKSTLEDLQGQDPQAVMAKYLEGVKNETAYGKAEIQVYETAIQNGQKTLNKDLISAIEKINKEQGVQMSTNLEGLYSKIGDRYAINYNKINSYNLNDDIKSMIVDEVKSWNEDLDAIETIQKKKLDRQKEFNTLYKNALSGMVDLEQKMLTTLKEKYQAEIDNLQNKYSAMEEADNDYVDELEKAIEKQRKLRDQENSWRDLADKERKLSLMQRDTSGGNLAETRSLQKEVQDDRTELLDNTVDNIIENLKEVYELQKESRDAEIEYRQTLIDEGALMREVTEALGNINTADDLVAWFYANTANLSEMSSEQIQQEEMSWRELFDSKMSWLTTSQTDFNDSLKVTQSDINTIVTETSETLTSSAQTTLDSVTDTVNTNIEEAKKSLTDAQDALAAAQKELNKAITESENATTNWKNAVGELDKVLQQIYDKYLTENTGATGSSGTADEERKKGLRAAAAQYKNNKQGFLDKYGKSNADAGDIWESVNNGTSNKLNPTISGFTKKIEEKNVEKWAAEQVKHYEDKGKDYVGKMQIKPSDVGINNDEALKAISAVKGQEYTLETDSKGRVYIKRSKSDKYGKSVLDSIKNDLNYFAPLFGRDTFFDAYATGGLVDYTGPAWVDGTKSRPEAFLSADDTKRIGEAAKILADLPLLNNTPSQTNEISNTNVGDTTYEIHINIENVSSDYDVDQAVERVKKDITDAANYAGSNVIIKKN